MDFASMISARLEELGENVNSFEMKQGWSQGYLRAVIRNDDKRTVPNIDRARRIAEALGLDFYIGPRREAGSIYTTEISNEDFDAIPRYDARLAAGAGAENHNVSLEGALAFRREWLSRYGISAASACLMPVAGDSMAPTLHDGDLVLIDQRRDRIRNHKVYALIDSDGMARVKRLDLVRGEMIVLTSDNPEHPTEIRRGEEMNRMKILGEVVWSGHAWIDAVGTL